MNKFLTILLGLLSISAFGQTKYEINGFSEKYKGVLIINSGYENDILKKGTISIIEIKTNEIIITISSENLTFELNNNGEIETNVLELPYGKQSLLICDDFNFDGKNDLAIMDGQQSCYGEPSFQVYLDNNDKLKYSPKFTQLAQEYCGMFEVNHKTKTIHTMTKSGCCWHQFSEFKVIDNEPIAIKVVEESLNANGFILNYSEKNRINGEMVEKKYSCLSDEADIIEVYSLTFKNGKKMELYRAFAFEDYLFYVFIDKNNKIELMYSDEFFFDKNKKTLTFTNQSTTYRIYPKGIIVNTAKKKVNMKAISVGENTTLSSLSDLSLKNLIKE